jgi:hypothetical protein
VSTDSISAAAILSKRRQERSPTDQVKAPIIKYKILGGITGDLLFFYRLSSGSCTFGHAVVSNEQTILYRHNLCASISHVKSQTKFSKVSNFSLFKCLLPARCQHFYDGLFMNGERLLLRIVNYLCKETRFFIG